MLNLAVLMGRLTRNPVVFRKEGSCPVTKFTLAVDRIHSKEDKADFIPCVMFGSESADFAEKYLVKGMRISVDGKIQTGSFDDKDGKRQYTTEVVVAHVEFAESKETSDEFRKEAKRSDSNSGDFMNLSKEDLKKLPFD